MRAYLPAYELRRAKTLREALQVLADEPGQWRPMAGGTDLMVLFEAGKLAHKKHLSIWGIKDLHGLKFSTKDLRIGALTTFGEIRDNAAVERDFPLLVRTACEVGALAIQNRATIGGNIVNASPAADSPPALLVYDAELEIVSKRGSRRVPYRDFHQGYKKMRLEADELVTAVILPRLPIAGGARNPHASASAASRASFVQHYRKVGTRRAQAISKVCIAALARLEEGSARDSDRAPILVDIRIALGAVAPVPMRCYAAEALLKGQSLNADTMTRAREALLREIAPIDDIRSTADYRRSVAANLVDDFLHSL